jgi:hypothetical protein
MSPEPALNDRQTGNLATFVRPMLGYAAHVPSRAAINALHEDQVRPVLQSLGVADAFDARTLVCDFCAKPLRDVGIATMRMEQGRLIFACTSPSCIEHFHE